MTSARCAVRRGLSAAISKATAEPQLAANQQTGLRLICNAFRHPALRQWVQLQRSALLDSFAPAFSNSSKAVRLAAATMLWNFAVARGAHLPFRASEGGPHQFCLDDGLAECHTCAGLQEIRMELCKSFRGSESCSATYRQRNQRHSTGGTFVSVLCMLLVHLTLL